MTGGAAGSDPEQEPGASGPVPDQEPGADAQPDRAAAPDGAPAADAAVGDRAARVEALAQSALGSGMARAVHAGASGEALSGASVLAAIGGWRGIAETVVPGLLFLILFIITQDARLSALIPGGLAVLLVLLRLVRREPLVSAISGMLGVGIAVLITLVTGRGVDYYLSGFVINAVYAVGILVSILVGWPLLGFVVGLLRGELTGWRRDPRARRTALLVTLLWLALFVARLAVQLPLYLADRVEALGIARLVMGTPLFALVIVLTWVIARRGAGSSSDDLRDGTVENTGQNAPER
ncbi:DUF3159 domain-containing protein [Leucobacter allii]|uniref:DUF3159 domain-containing protein n=1 Tax=Leucobacter allii TaxID=2932247 RepID=A0ABY4FQQ0_9MICO|nr:DUF3159 domain-containing protein [Leucobacter allii]UOQ58613.1 DUF3159 domain-containing protein [Leucobacter allii]